ncbi:TPA_asm: P5 [Arceuthobium sichuanense virus 2]|nr:TPA_asm: P5 [Arceuthobium sichuanense virus 2]
MAGFEDEWSGSEGEIEYEQDDKLLCDLHLNSALNIDFLRVTMGQEVKYTCIPPQRIISSYNKGTKIVKDIYERNFTSKAPSFSTGAVRSKVRHTRCSEIMEPWKDNWLEHTIGELDTCFAERGFTMAFKRAQQCLKDKHVILPVGLLGSFTKVMNLCLSVSETLRGGSIPRLFSGSVLSEGKHLYTTLATAYGPGMIATDGTTVFHMWGELIVLK